MSLKTLWGIYNMLVSKQTQVLETIDFKVKLVPDLPYCVPFCYLISSEWIKTVLGTSCSEYRIVATMLIYN